MINSQVIAHRFGAGLGPENTKAALLESLKLGVRWVEFDVCLIGGDDVIVFHDNNFDRCTNLQGNIIDSTLAEVRQMDVGAWFGEQFAGEKILELGEALRLLQLQDVCINLELKIHENEDVVLAQRVHQIVEANWSEPNRLIYSSFSHASLACLRELDQTANIGHLFGHLPRNWQALAEAVTAKTIHGDVGEFSIRDIETVKEAGYPLYLYTVNDLDQAENLIAAGVDGVFTDYPNLFDQNWY